MSQLRLRTLVTCDKTIVSTWGDIDMASAPLLRERLSALAASGCGALVLNLSHTSYIDSSGLAALSHAHKALRGHGGELSLIRCRPSTARVLHMVGFHHLFSIEEHLPRAKHSAAA